MADDRQPVGGVASGGDQLLGNGAEVLDRHEHDDHRRGGGDRRPVDRLRQLAGLVVAGEEDHRVVGVAMGHRDARIGEAAEAGGDARHDAELHPGPRQRAGLLAAAAEHERIAALEPQHALAGLGQLDQLQRDIGLLRRRLAAALAGMDVLSRGVGELEQRLRHQRVVDDDIGLLQRVIAEQRQQSRRTGTGADQPHRARLENRPIQPVERHKAHAIEPATKRVFECAF